MRISVLGSTGVIGTLTLELAEKYSVEVVALAAGRNLSKLSEQTHRFRPKYVAVQRREDAEKLGKGVLWGREGLNALATLDEADLVVIGVSGTAGIEPTYMAAKAGKRIALANKESMVSGGKVIGEAAKENSAVIIPVDSEHSSLFQLLLFPEQPQEIFLTASGGPFFRGRPQVIRIEDVLSHPTWRMGKKITVDSATLMNKAFEMVEARWLFNFPPERIKVLIHPQSAVHALARMKDGTLFAHMGPADMRLPIQYALFYPERKPPPSPPLNLENLGHLEFYPAPPEKYPAIELGYRMMQEACSLAAVINGANDFAVESFLEGKLNFDRILDVIIEVSKVHRPYPLRTIEEVLEAVKEGRERAKEISGVKE